MSDSILLAVLAGLGGMIGWGFADFFAKKTVDRVGDIVSLVWAHLFGVSFFILIALYKFAVTGDFVQIPHGLGTWIGLVFFGVLQMIVYWLVYKGFGKGQLAVLNPVFASYSGIVAFISILFIGEALTPLTAIALPAIFVGILLLNSDFNSLRDRRLNLVPGLKEVGAAAILAAVWTLGWDKFVGGRDFLGYVMFMYIFMSLAALAFAKALRTKLMVVKGDLWRFLALIGLGETLAYFSITLGFSKTTHTSIVALISGSFSVLTVVLAYRYLHERISSFQTLGIIVIIAGIILISLA